MIRRGLTIVKANVSRYLTPMPIRWNIAKILNAQGTTPYRLAKLTGLSVPSCYDLANAELPPVIKIATLDKLCRALDCTPGDLLEYRKR